MISAILSLLFFIVIPVNLSASETKSIDTGELSFKKVGERFEAVIDGYSLDEIGEKPALPFKKFFFKKPVKSVEILSSRIVKAPGKLKTGNPFYRISPEGMKKVRLSEKTLALPRPDNFYESEFLGFKLGVPTYKLRFSPLIPLGDNKYMYIRRIRVKLGEKPLFQVRNSTDNKKSLLIITTREIRNRSAKLSEFVAAKRQHGFIVDVATEDEFGGQELFGQDKAIVVRDWLKSVRSEYRFLLIIASPVPGSKGIPMVTKEQRVPGSSGSTMPQYESIPTDTFYSELYADWDSDGDGIIGGQRDRDISFQYQLVTGRIPVYDSSDVSKLDEILDKTISFMNKSPNTPYRKNILVPASIAYFENQDNMGYPQMDGAYVAEYIDNNFIEEPFKLDILVEKEGLSTSEFTDFPALNYSSMEEYLNRGNGVVFWQGHGLATLTVRTIWGNDTNNNEIPDSRELQSTTFVDSEMALRVQRDKPGFIYEGSCLNGKAEVNDNLGYTMLQGPGIGVAASTRVTYGGINKNYNPDVYQDKFAYGTYFTKSALENGYPAEEIFEKKSVWGSRDVLEAIKFMLTYYGDPSLRLGAESCDSDSDCDDGIFCNGKEYCNNGLCDIKEMPLDCPQTDEPCYINVCDEETQGCLLIEKDNGSSCGNPDDKCLDRAVCESGVCVKKNPVDCSKLDSECGKGSCNPDTGKCEVKPDESTEGNPCDDGDFCTVDEICKNGMCRGEERECDQEEAPQCKKLYCSKKEQSCIAVQDRESNGISCVSEENYKGYCDYGECFVPDNAEKAGGNEDGPGCSLSIIP